MYAQVLCNNMAAHYSNLSQACGWEPKKVVTVHTMHTYGGAEVLVHSLTLAIDVEAWSASHRIRNQLGMTK
jgi:hypothetical protein